MFADRGVILPALLLEMDRGEGQGFAREPQGDRVE
jgi:hypothetical protein